MKMKTLMSNMIKINKKLNPLNNNQKNNHSLTKILKTHQNKTTVAVMTKIKSYLIESEDRTRTQTDTSVMSQEWDIWNMLEI